MNKRKLIVKMKFGSHLYGTATEESDIDYKGIYMPSKRDIFLGRISKTDPDSIHKRRKKEGEKNTKDDIDEEIYSLHYFIKLACEGQTGALDMLHAPDNMLESIYPNWASEKAHPIWKEIVKNREKFYTKNLEAFVGYARKQASKYGIKGSKCFSLKSILEYIGDNFE